MNTPTDYAWIWFGLIVLALCLGMIVATLTYVLAWHFGERRKFARARVAMEMHSALNMLPVPLVNNNEPSA